MSARSRMPASSPPSNMAAPYAAPPAASDYASLAGNDFARQQLATGNLGSRLPPPPAPPPSSNLGGRLPPPALPAASPSRSRSPSAAGPNGQGWAAATDAPAPAAPAAARAAAPAAPKAAAAPAPAAAGPKASGPSPQDIVADAYAQSGPGRGRNGSVDDAIAWIERNMKSAPLDQRWRWQEAVLLANKRK